MAKARKFKKKLAPKVAIRKKAEPVLSVELIRKETLQKIAEFWKKVSTKFKTVKLAK